MSAGTVERPGKPATQEELGRAPRVLLVDDEASMRDMLRIVLRRDGYEVLVADGVRAALAILEKEHIDLLLSDIRMPDGSGVDVVRAAKAANRDIVAFMMTAFASTDTAVEAMRLGAVDYFTKPFNVDELRLKIGQHLETRRLKEENVVLKRALNATHEFSSLIGPQPGHAGAVPADRDRGQDAEHGADHGRVGHRQGDGGQGHPRQLAAARPAVRGAELRRRAGDAARVGAVRPRARRLHRRGREQEGPGRGGRGRHHLPRRDRRDEPQHAGQAAARAAGAPLPPPGRHHRGAGRRPGGGRHAPGPAGADCRRAVPGRPLLPDQRHPGAAAAAPRAPGGHRAAGRALSAHLCRADGQAGHRDRQRGAARS